MENSGTTIQIEPKLIVFYVDVRGLSDEKIAEVVQQVNNGMNESTTFKSMNASTITIPIMGQTRVECINPKYIKDDNLIREHTIIMSELHEHLKYQVEQLKEIKKKSEPDGQ